MPSVLLPELERILENDPVAFLQPKTDLHASTVQYVQQLLDPLARETTEAQKRREDFQRQERKRKRKDGYNGLPAPKQRRIAQIYTDGFEVEQIWSQAKLVLDQATENIERELSGVLKDSVRQTKPNAREPAENGAVPYESEANGTEGGDSEPDGSIGGSGEEELLEDNFSSVDSSGGLENMDDGNDILNGVNGSQKLKGKTPNGLGHDGDDDIDASELDEEVEEFDNLDQLPRDELVKDKHGLNDGFFSIDQFNKQTQFLEIGPQRAD